MYNVKDKKNLASYTTSMDGPLHFMRCNGKNFFFTKVGDKQLGLR